VLGRRPPEPHGRPPRRAESSGRLSFRALRRRASACVCELGFVPWVSLQVEARGAAPRRTGGVSLVPGYRVDAPRAVREVASAPAGRPAHPSAVLRTNKWLARPPCRVECAGRLGDEREALWPGAGVAQRHRGSHQALRRTPGGRASPVRGAKTLGGPPVGFGPIRNQQTTTAQSSEAQ
jgi:hypothetical protein